MNRVTSKDGTTIAYDRTGQSPALIHVLGATATRAMAAQQSDTDSDSGSNPRFTT